VRKGRHPAAGWSLLRPAESECRVSCRQAATAAAVGVLVLTWTACVTAGGVTGPAPQASSFEDFRYSGRAIDPSGDKPQSKLWYAHGSWWGVLAASARRNSAATRIYRLASNAWIDTGTVVDARPDSTADVLWDGRRLFVASRTQDAPLSIARFRYDRDRRTWSMDSGFPVRLGTGSESAAIAEDSTGRLWVTYTSARHVWVAHSAIGQRAWSQPFDPVRSGTTISSDDISSIVSFDDKIGVMWSDQHKAEFGFAVHRDGDNDATWSQEVAESGLLSADDHMHLATVPSSSGSLVVAAVKTSVDKISGVTPAADQILVLVRSPGGAWLTRPAGTVEDGSTRPSLVVDESNREVYLLTASWRSGIYFKQSTFGRLTFDGTWNTLIAPTFARGIDNPTSSKAPVTRRSGLLVLASAQGSHRYYHAELPLPRPAGGRAAPQPPGLLQADVTRGCQVNLTWTQAPGEAEGTEYLLARDGSYLTTTAGTEFTDSAVDCGSAHRYTVFTRDSSGKTSAASSPATVTTPDAVHRGSGIWLRSTAAAVGGADGRISVTLPSVQRGDVLLASISRNGRGRLAPPPGWQWVQHNVSGRAMTMDTYARLARRHEAGGYTWGVGAGGNAVLNLAVYAGADSKDPVADSSGQVAAASSRIIPLPALDFAPPGSAAIGFFAVSAKAALSSPPEMVANISAGHASGGSAVSAGSAQELDVTTPQAALVATASWPGRGIGQLIVLRPAARGTGQN
jgi:hypothetical protein